MKLIIAILLLAIGSFAQNTTYKDGTECYCDSLVITYTASEANAVSGDTDITKDVVREIPFKNGTINGMWKSYYESGSIRSELPYINGNMNGFANMYYESGSIELELPIINGYEYGVAKQYYESGALLWEIPYIYGKEYGVVKSYYESGALAGTATYKNGKKHGVCKWYYESGALAGTATYKNGNLVGYKKQQRSKMVFNIVGILVSVLLAGLVYFLLFVLALFVFKNGKAVKILVDEGELIVGMLVTFGLFIFVLLC